MKRFAILAAALAFAACATGAPTLAPAGGSLAKAQKPDQIPRPPVDKIDTSDACGAGKLQALVGNSVKEPQVPKEGPAVRYIYPDTIITMDFRFDRLNLELSKDGTILKVRCG